MGNALVLITVGLLGSLFFGVLPVVLILVLSQLLQILGPTVLSGLFAAGVTVLYVALVWFRRSFWMALLDVGALYLATVGWVVSKFATAIRRLGTIMSFMGWVKAGLGLYPGKDFIKNRREEVVQRGIKHHERGDVEIEDSPEALARDTRQAYDDAGRRLSNGEAVLGLTLAGVTLLPSKSPIVPYSELLGSSAVGASLSVALVLVVALRLSVLDMVLVRDPTDSGELARLAVYRDWNRTMSSGAEVVKAILMFRVMRSINDSAYDFYLDWVFEKAINGNGAGIIELLLELRRPMFAFHIAECEGISPSEASLKLYRWDVFSQFSFGPGEAQSAPDEIPTSRFDAVFLPFLRLKYEIRNGVRVVRANQLAEKEDMPPEEASRELYDENVIPEPAVESEGKQDHDD
ncbi:hypothetical protein [Halosegnis longus]|uniref:Uncharacterized protein n=1 Tax=Halosegnis longus TaxID=2216012 RepID=A0AAJ4R5S0_9EURY|nr:hypothetical protein Nmn1133_14020 [Salella cibi]